MRYLVVIVAFFTAGIIYVNYYIAQKEEEKNVRFVISQKAQLEAEDAQKELTADLLSAAQKRVRPVQDTVQNNSASTLKDNTKKLSTQTGLEVKTSAQAVITPKTSFQLTKSLPGKDINTWATGKPLSFEFNEEVDIESFFQHFLISPSIDGKFSGEMDYGENQKTIVVKSIPELKPGNYTLTLKKGLKNFSKTNELSQDIILSIEIK